MSLPRETDNQSRIRHNTPRHHRQCVSAINEVAAAGSARTRKKSSHIFRCPLCHPKKHARQTLRACLLLLPFGARCAKRKHGFLFCFTFRSILRLIISTHSLQTLRIGIYKYEQINIKHKKQFAVRRAPPFSSVKHIMLWCYRHVCRKARGIILSRSFNLIYIVPAATTKPTTLPHTVAPTCFN